MNQPTEQETTGQSAPSQLASSPAWSTTAVVLVFVAGVVVVVGLGLPVVKQQGGSGRFMFPFVSPPSLPRLALARHVSEAFARITALQSTANESFHCSYDSTAPEYVTRKRKRNYYRHCASRFGIRRTAAPQQNSTVVVVNSAAFPPSAVAVCMSGVVKRQSAVLRAQLSNLLDPNDAHVYVHVWPMPDDSWEWQDLHGAAHQQMVTLPRVVAARADQYSPVGMFDKDRMTRNGAPMYFGIEACFRLVIATPKYRSGYDFLIRSRIDLVVNLPVTPRFVAASQCGTDDGASNDTQNAFQLRRRGPLFHKDVVVMHHHTFCCANDWMAVGTFWPMMFYAFIYSDATTTRAYAPSAKGVSSSFGPRGCTGEQCISHALRRNAIRWALTDLNIQLGGPNHRINVQRGSHCLAECPYDGGC